MPKVFTPHTARPCSFSCRSPSSRTELQGSGGMQRRHACPSQRQEELGGERRWMIQRHGLESGFLSARLIKIPGTKKAGCDIRRAGGVGLICMSGSSRICRLAVTELSCPLPWQLSWHMEPLRAYTSKAAGPVLAPTDTMEAILWPVRWLLVPAWLCFPSLSLVPRMNVGRRGRGFLLL